MTVPVAMIVLYQNQHFLMQLRDDKQEILYPGQWGLFGGHLELEEEPEVGILREVQEEIDYCLPQVILFNCYQDQEANRYIFFSPLTVDLTLLKLNEGQDLDLVPIDNVQQGYHYSSKLGQQRRLGKIHRRILLDFLKFAQKNIVDF